MAFDFNMVVYLLGVAAMAGAVMSRISALEKKVDKHNNLIERMYRIEMRVTALEDRSEREDYR